MRRQQEKHLTIKNKVSSARWIKVTETPIWLHFKVSLS